MTPKRAQDGDVRRILQVASSVRGDIIEIRWQIRKSQTFRINPIHKLFLFVTG